MSLLHVVVGAPLLGALLVAWRHWSTPVAAWFGALVSALSLAAATLAWGTKSDLRLYASATSQTWIEPLGAEFHLGMDGVSYAFVAMTAVLGTACCLHLVRHAPAGDGSPRGLIALVLLVEGASLGVFTSLDLLLFFVFFELALVPMWFVIAGWGDEHDPAGRRRAATRFLLFTVTGSALMFVGFIVVAVKGGSLQIPALALRAGALADEASLLAGVAIAVGLAVKTPVWPLHIWLPDAHGRAPTVGSVLLAGVFLKLGTYGFIRILVPILPVPTQRLAPWLAGFAVVGIVYSALACLRQTDLKRLIAYSSVGHMGFVVLAVATLTTTGVVAAVFASVAHGLITGLLFFCAGMIKERYGTSALAGIDSGLYGRVPWLAAVLAFGCLASLGLPGLAGFWGEMLALRSAYEVGPTLDRATAWTLLGVALLGVVLTTAYFLGLMRTLLQGDAGAPDVRPRDLDGHEATVVGGLGVLVLLLGIAPGLLSELAVSAAPWILGGVR